MILGWIHVVFAQYSNWQRLGDGLYRGRGTVESGDIVLYTLAGVIVALLAAITYAHRQANELTQPYNDPSKLFRELCRAHELDRRSKRLLRQLAHVRCMSQPAEVFVTPSAFDAADLPPPLAAQHDRLQELRERLF